MRIVKISQEGSALIYILIAVGLLALLTASLMNSSNQQTSAQNAMNTFTNLSGQVNFIRSAIQECVLTYSGGDPGLAGTPNVPYPINPSSIYLSSPDANNDAVHIRCPGNPGISNNHSDIFAGASGKFLPPPPNLFEPWRYHNGQNGVFIFIRTNKTDAYLLNAMRRLDDTYAECEADIIDAFTTPGPINLTAGETGTAPTCPDDNYCFRVWVIANPSNIYPGDTDSDEAGCP